jgi:hypothetical protein
MHPVIFQLGKIIAHRLVMVVPATGYNKNSKKGNKEKRAHKIIFLKIGFCGFQIPQNRINRLFC